MKISRTELKDCYVLEPTIFTDSRGYFMESYNENVLSDFLGCPIHFVQDNQSYSTKGVLRGLHYQKGNHAQAKLVRVVQGTVLDVVVDIRPESSNYGKYITEILSGENQKQLFIPRGFAHGFLVLSDTALFVYKCDNYYCGESEAGIIYNDKDLQIDWGASSKDFIISDKDLVLPLFQNSEPIW